jgi:hypothetical protein
MVPGLLLALGATAVHAGPEPAAAPAISTAPAAPLDPALPPAGAALAALVGPPAAAVHPLQTAPADVKEVVRWITGSGDNTRLPFLVIDKPNARVYAFNPAGQFQGDAPVLLGMGVGDRMLLPSAKMSQMPPHTRITPAGRFVSKLSRDAKGKELLVLDYKAAFSLHPVVKGQPWEHRADRLASVTSGDNRISFGCINVPVPFYETVISRAFASTHGIVYILPETSRASAMFGFNPVYEAIASGPRQAAPAPRAAAPAGAQQVAPAGLQRVTAALKGTASPTVPESAAK